MRSATARTLLALVPVGLAAAGSSVDPYALGAGACGALIALAGPASWRGPAGGLAVGLLGGPAFELPVSWLALIAAGLIAEGRWRWSVVPAVAGLVLSVTWGCDPGLWPAWVVLGALAAAAGPWDEALFSATLVCAGLGALRASEVLRLVDVGPAEVLPDRVERYGAAWAAGRVEGELLRSGWLRPEDTRRDRARRIAELGGGRLAFRALGTEPLPTWERAALLHQCGRLLPAWVLGFAEGPEDPAHGPGVVWSREQWRDAEHVVVPVRLNGPATELVVRAEGSFFLGWPELTVQVGGQRLGPVAVPEEGDTWVVPVQLARGVHRLTAEFTNPYGARGARRVLTRVEVELR